MSYLEKMDKYLDSLKVGKSALVDSWFMMSGPVPIMLVVIVYLIVIRVGPKIMKNRPPLIMNKLIAYYNAAQVLLASAICTKAFKLELFKDGILYAGCRYPHFNQNSSLMDLGWWYFFAKFTELLDTVFFVLRKKEKQITFLHVYHHVIMALYSWSYLKFAAAGDGAILALLNSIVHVVMYTYYLLSGLGPRFQKYLWWKKYVTKLQLTQFILMLLYCVWTHFSPRCQYAAPFTYFISANVTIFLVLFLNFYAKSYKNRKGSEKKIESDQTTRNGFSSGICKPNGITPDKLEENGVSKRDCKSSGELEEIPYEVNKGCGDYTKDGKVFMTRRTAKAAFGPEYDFDSIIAK
ncbi:elongation of very long chain fatty acids protein 7-like [Galleria mellonella]|uniref:Elongation of very long chain fatty acids protein n=1 Tax=Galleria mellonella TaxID=7137 RepID=A0A6J1WKD1_GALME|nr:elongation of very long chain fatty acids protein 7-like [Galleria mellonella]